MYRSLFLFTTLLSCNCLAVNNISTVPLFGRNPHLVSGSTCSLTCVTSSLSMILVMILPEWDSREMPLLLPHSNLSLLFLYIVMMLEFFSKLEGQTHFPILAVLCCRVRRTATLHRTSAPPIELLQALEFCSSSLSRVPPLFLATLVEGLETQPQRTLGVFAKPPYSPVCHYSADCGNAEPNVRECVFVRSRAPSADFTGTRVVRGSYNPLYRIIKRVHVVLVRKPLFFVCHCIPSAVLKVS